MKIGKMALVYAFILSLMLGAVVVLPLTSAQALKANIRFDPRTYVLDTPYPDPWNVIIWLTHGYKVGDIDVGTIWLSDPEAPSTPIQPIGTAIVKTKLVASFDGQSLWRMIWQKLLHLALLIAGRVRLLFRITLQTIDGTVFEGNGYITVIIEEPPPPPPE